MSHCFSKWKNKETNRKCHTISHNENTKKQIENVTLFLKMEKQRTK